jgi:hypothetical protein
MQAFSGFVLQKTASGICADHGINVILQQKTARLCIIY